jgi:gamma-glutamyl:cysteine ligase YbdK (ATP-grasp superfamily)
MSSTFNDLLTQINYRPELSGHIGIEREFFLVNEFGQPVPRSPEFLGRMSDQQWGYELSACQVEHRTPPLNSLDQVRQVLTSSQSRGQEVARIMGCQMVAREVGPEDMDLTVYKYNQRYQQIAAALSVETLRAANRVTGTHFHIGVRDFSEALALHNLLAPHIGQFIEIGSHDPVRMQLYQTMAPNWRSPVYESAEHFVQVAQEQGFTSNLRDCWHLVRISIHGTVEVRPFGVTEDIDEIIGWIEYVSEIAEDFLRL